MTALSDFPEMPGSPKGINPNIQTLVLFYKPPCGKWYVHSHKTYPSVEDAYAAAKKFLHPDTPIAVLPVDVDYLETVHKIRIGELS